MTPPISELELTEELDFEPVSTQGLDLLAAKVERDRLQSELQEKEKRILLVQSQREEIQWNLNQMNAQVRSFVHG